MRLRRSKGSEERKEKEKREKKRKRDSRYVIWEFLLLSKVICSF